MVFLAKEAISRTLVFLISDKKGTSKSSKMAILREKKGNFREPVAKFEKIASLVFDKKNMCL